MVGGVGGQQGCSRLDSQNDWLKQEFITRQLSHMAKFAVGSRASLPLSEGLGES